MNYDPNIAGAMMEAAKEPLANITNPPTRSIGKFFGDTLDFWFSNRILKYAKKKIMDEVALRKFREECEAEFAYIPTDKLIPPRKALLLPALDAAEYFVEEDELRQMFARLVAATCDRRKASKVHPSFVKIIQELSPLDVENLLCFKDFNYVTLVPNDRNSSYYTRVLAIASVIVSFGPKDPLITTAFCNIKNCFVYNKNEDNNELLQSSIAILSALGLVSFDYSEGWGDAVPPIDTFKKFAAKNVQRYYSEPLGEMKIYDRGQLVLSRFGDDFLSVCLTKWSNTTP